MDKIEIKLPTTILYNIFPEVAPKDDLSNIYSNVLILEKVEIDSKDFLDVV